MQKLSEQYLYRMLDASVSSYLELELFDIHLNLIKLML